MIFDDFTEMCFKFSGGYNEVNHTHCLLIDGTIYRTLAHAKSACSKDTRCMGIENPTCDNFSSRLCLATFDQTILPSYQYQSNMITNDYVDGIYVKAERHGRSVF